MQVFSGNQSLVQGSASVQGYFAEYSGSPAPLLPVGSLASELERLIPRSDAFEAVTVSVSPLSTEVLAIAPLDQKLEVAWASVESNQELVRAGVSADPNALGYAFPLILEPGEALSVTNYDHFVTSTSHAVTRPIRAD